MALGIVVVGGNMDPTDYYNKTQADKLLAKKLGLHDTADNSAKWGDYERRFNETTGSTHVLVETDGKYVDLRPADSIGLTAIAASGAGYIRFGDGTQICWGETDQMVVRANSTVTATIAYPVAFASGYPVEVSLTIAGNSENDSYSRLVLHTTKRATTNCVIYFKNTSSKSMSPIAQWIAIGRWK